jgi:HEAT repeat protein
VIELLPLMDRADKEPAEALVAIAEHGDLELRATAIQGLRHVYQTSDRIVAVLVRALEEDDPLVRCAVIRAGRSHAKGRGELVPGLRALLDDESYREDAAEALGMVGYSARAAVPALRALLDGDHLRVRIVVAHALLRLDEDPEPLLPLLLQGLRSSDRLSLQPAVEALGDAGTAAAAHWRELAALLDHSEWDVRSDAAEALGKLGPSASGAIPALRRVAENEEEKLRVRDRARRAIEALE